MEITAVRPITHETATWIEDSAQVTNFLNTVAPGQKLGIFDMDRCLWNADTDVEDIAFNKFGLINDIPAWERANQNLEDSGTNFMGAYHPIDLEHQSKTVTPEISSLTGLEEGTPMSPIVLHEIGKAVGKHIVDNSLFRPVALEVLKECERRGIRIVIITATSRHLAKGAIDYASEALDLPEITVLGTEDNFTEDGTATESVLFMGPRKTEILRAAKQRGVIPVIGAGDKFLTSDIFVSQCLIKGQIDNKTLRKGDEAWELVHQQLTSLLGFPYTE